MGFLRAFVLRLEWRCIRLASMRLHGMRAAKLSYCVSWAERLHQSTTCAVLSCVSSTFAVMTRHATQYELRLPRALLAALSCMHSAVAAMALPENISTDAYVVSYVRVSGLQRAQTIMQHALSRRSGRLHSSGMRERLGDVASCETVWFRIWGGQDATFRKALMTLQ